jgi:hypothetical protein
LHDLDGALTYLEDALPITSDPVEQTALHERAVGLATLVSKFGKALEHAAAAKALSEARGDRLGVLRAKALEAEALVTEHQDRRAIAPLREALADVEDLGQAPEIASAQTQLSRALMLAGESAESVAWADRVLERPGAAGSESVIEALVTRGTALQSLGRQSEAEAVLRGAIEVAEAMGNLSAANRARNNLRVQLMSTDLAASLEMNREIYDLTKKYGQRMLVLHALGAALDISFRLGNWDDWIEESRAEMSHDTPYYASWFRMEELFREVYRGDPAATERALDELLLEEGTSSSEQAMGWTMTAKADARLAQDDPAGALAIATEAARHSAENDLAHIAAVFAAATLRDPTGINAARAAWRLDGSAELLPLQQALELAADALAAAIEARWDDARAAYGAAERQLDEIGQLLVLARLRLAFAGIVSGYVPDGDAIWSEGARFFEERGAAHYVTGYRQTVDRFGTSEARDTTSVRSAPVRAAR